MMPRSLLLDGRVDQGGVGRYVRDLAEWLAERSSEIGFKTHVLEGSSTFSPFTPWGRRSVARKAERLRVDLIHVAHLEAPRSNKPLVVTVHDLIPLEFPGSMRSRIRRFEFRRLIEQTRDRADHVIVPSTRTRDQLIDFGFDASRTAVVPMGANEVFRPLAISEREEARRRFAGGARYVATFAGRKAHKNTAILEDVARALRDKGLRLIAFGDSAPPEGATHTGGLTDDDLRIFYGGAEVFFLPSVVEGFGLPVLEAACCATPIVCSPDVGVLSFLGDAPLVVDVTDPAAATEALLAIAEDDDERKIRSDAVRTSSRGLPVDEMGKATVAIYEELLSEG